MIISLFSSIRAELPNRAFSQPLACIWLRCFSLSLLLGACTAPSDSADAVTTPSSAAQATPQKTAPIDAKNGFRTHHFGDDLHTFSDLELNASQSTPLKRVYQKRHEQKRIGTTPVFILRYNFYHNTFYGVDIETTLEVLPTLMRLYGPASQTDVAQQRYWWIGQMASATLQKAPGATPWLSIWNNRLRQQLEAAEQAARQQQTQQASPDL